MLQRPSLGHGDAATMMEAWWWGKVVVVESTNIVVHSMKGMGEKE